MPGSEYRPVDCGLHSEYELMAMHRSRVRLVYFSENSGLLSAEGVVWDVLTRDKAEYLVLKIAAEPLLYTRLDRIRAVERL